MREKKGGRCLSLKVTAMNIRGIPSLHTRLCGGPQHSQGTLVLMSHRAGRGPQRRLHSPREVLVSDCHGISGWAMGLGHGDLRRSLSIPHHERPPHSL